jgi:hypothetical protein
VSSDVGGQTWMVRPGSFSVIRHRWQTGLVLSPSIGPDA